MNRHTSPSSHSNRQIPSRLSLSAAGKTMMVRLFLLQLVFGINFANVAHAQTNYTTPYSFATFTGSGVGPYGGSTDGTGTAASFRTPSAVAVDSTGNIFVADTFNHKVRKITPAGMVSTFAGCGIPGGLDGSAETAFFNTPTGIAVDTSGNVFVADSASHKIRKITPAGVVSTLAGSGTQGSADGVGSAASFYNPSAVAVDAGGNVYVADSGNYRIRKITSAGAVTTLAGSGSYGSTNGTGPAASFSYARGIAVDPSGNLFVADTDNHKIRKITPAGVVSTFAGSGSSGSTDGTGTAASFFSPNGVAADANGNVFVVDTNNRKIRKITSAGAVSTLAGSGASGSADGTGTAASFNSPRGLVVDTSGNIFVADGGNNSIRKISQTAVVTTVAGINMAQDGSGANANFYSPKGVALDSSGNVYVADQLNHKIRKITPAGVVATLAGSGSIGSVDGTGTTASFREPSALTVDSSGNVFVADRWNSKIRKITPAGVVTTFAGSGSQYYGDGTGTLASFNLPEGIAVDGNGNLYVADTSNHMIRKITPAGVVTKLAGATPHPIDGPISGYADGTGSDARFSYPTGIALDPSGNVIVADRNNYKIRKITQAGVVTTIAGAGPFGGWIDGPAATAGFQGPRGVTVDAAGNIFVTDYISGGRHKIRKITPEGVVSSVAGGEDAGSADGNGMFAEFNWPDGVAVDSAGTLWVADTGNNKIRRGTASGLQHQRIDFAPLAAKSSQDAPFVISATATSGLPVSFTIQSGPATLSGSTVTLTGAGTVVIRANQSGSNSFEAAPPVYQSFEVSAGPTPSYRLHEFTTLVDPIDQPNITVDASDNLYFGGLSTTLIQKITPTGATSIFADKTQIYGNNMTADANGNLYIAASIRIYKVSPTGVISVLAGSGSQGSADGIGTAASFAAARDLAVDSAGNVFVVDSNNCNIRKITSSGVVSTIAGSIGDQGGKDGIGLNAWFRDPRSITIDASGNLYVADSGNNKIRKITPAGVVTTLAGNRLSGYADGTGAAASFNFPSGIAVDANGDLYVADSSNRRIRKIRPWGEVTTIAGSGSSGNTNGIGNVASFVNPYGVEVDSTGNLYVADISGKKVRKGTLLTGETLPQNITFSPLSDKLVGDPAFALVATASSGLQVSFAVVNGPATVSGNIITLTGTGMVTVRASQAGNSFYTAAPNVERTFFVKSAQAITFYPLPGKFLSDVPFTLSATASSGLPVAFSILSGPATISSNTVTLTGLGTVVIRASQAGNASYTEAPVVDQSFNVTAGSVDEVALKDWATTAGLTGTVAEPTAIPFNDGVSNLLKYAFNMNASGPDSSVLAPGGSSGLPLVSLDKSGAQPVLKVEFLRRKGSGLVYTPQRSTTLDGFVAMAGTQTVTSINDQWERVTVQETAPPVTPTSSFARVEVRLP